MTEQLTNSQKPCACCGGKMIYKYNASPLDYCLDKSFGIYKCENCGHGITDGVETGDLNRVYEEGAYDPKEKVWHRVLRPILNTFEGAKVGYIKKNLTAGKLLLEVGTGKGSFLHAAIKAGFDGYGIEPSQRSYSVAKKRLNERVINCTLEQMHVHSQFNRQFDFIMLWHVLEHLPHPEEMVTTLKKHLKPGGMLVVGVPSFCSFQAEWGKANWYHLDPPRHLSHFTPDSARKLFAQLGLKDTKIVYTSFFQNYLGDLITFNNLILSHKNILLNCLRFNHFYFERKSLISRVFNLLAFFVITGIIFLPCLIFTLLSQLVGKSGTIVILSKKDKNEVL